MATLPGEDAHPVIRAAISRRQQERGFGEVHPVGEPLHLFACEVLGFSHHGERIAAVGLGGEDIQPALKGMWTGGRGLAGLKRKPPLRIPEGTENGGGQQFRLRSDLA